MADFRIWGRVEHIGVKQFLAIASGVPESGDRAIVLTGIAPSLPEANQEKHRLMRKVGDQVRARGHQVVDTED